MKSLFDILVLLLDIAKWTILAHFIMSWLVSFQVVNLRQPLVAGLWNTLNRVLEPVYSRVRRYVPPVSGIDFAPLLVLLAVYGLRIVLWNNQDAFY